MMMRKPILCNDGTIISVQASSRNYCAPKRDDALSYGAVEIQITRDAETYNDNENTTGFFNVRDLFTLINRHGGIAGGELPPLNFGNHEQVDARIDEIREAGEALYNAQQKAKEEEE
jgi:hypothetical protein